MMGLPRGILLVAMQEFRIRLRTGRWRWLLGGWVVLLAIFTALLDSAITTGYAYDPDNTRRGVPLFGILMLFVLGMVLVISPALTSQAINGDRERGTLATLQVTRLRPVEIALGKLFSAWAVGLVMLVLSFPFVGYAMIRGGISFGRVGALYGVTALLIGVVCALSQALSAMLARSITSALLSYLTVAALTIGTLISFALFSSIVTEERTIGTPGGGSYVSTRNRPDLVWWMLAPNPFVVLADSAPRVPPRYTVSGDVIQVDNYDPLSALSNAIRRVRKAPADYYTYKEYEKEGPPVWPWGLGFDLLLGAGAVVVTTRRLRTPSRKLGKGVRIA